MTPEEFIDKNYFSLTIDCKKEINEIYQALKHYADYSVIEKLTEVVEKIDQLACDDNNEIDNND